MANAGDVVAANNAIVHPPPIRHVIGVVSLHSAMQRHHGRHTEEEVDLLHLQAHCPLLPLHLCRPQLLLCPGLLAGAVIGRPVLGAVCLGPLRLAFALGLARRCDRSLCIPHPPLGFLIPANLQQAPGAKAKGKPLKVL